MWICAVAKGEGFSWCKHIVFTVHGLDENDIEKKDANCKTSSSNQ